MLKAVNPYDLFQERVPRRLQLQGGKREGLGIEEGPGSVAANDGRAGRHHVKFRYPRIFIWISSALLPVTERFQNLLVRKILEGILNLGKRPENVDEVRQGADVDCRLVLRDGLAELVIRLGERDDRHRLRKVGVGGRPRQQTKIINASLVRIAPRSQPGAMTLALP